MKNQQPNLLFIFPDELRQQALGFMGQDPVITPNLDRFASESLVLTHAVSPSPMCSPYRAMLFTGMYPHSNGVVINCNSYTAQYGSYLKETDICFSDVLHAAGYSQGYIGKWHLDPPSPEHTQYTEGVREDDGLVWDAYTPPGPRRHGFDFWHSYGCCDLHLTPHYWTGDAKVNERIDVQEWSVKHETDVALDYIRNQNGAYRDADKPFSLFISYNPPHMPFKQVPAQYLEPYADLSSEELLNRPNVRLEGVGSEADKHIKNYFAAITGIDEQIGRILETLQAEGLDENTIVVFTSDHGEMMGSHGLMGKNVWYDESYLVPFIIRWPEKIQPGQDDFFLSAPDFMPTLLNLMGQGDDVPERVEGLDLSAAFLGRDGERPESALYLDVYPARHQIGKRGLRTHRYTFVVIREKGQAERYVLHDNKNDPYQLRNIAQDEPGILADLQVELDNWLNKTNDPWKVKEIHTT